MKRRLAPEEKQELVARYQMGEPVKLSSLWRNENRGAISLFAVIKGHNM